MRPRPSNPSASQPGCASRARATVSATSSGLMLFTQPTIAPVAGFSSAMSGRQLVSTAAGLSSTVAMPSPSRSLLGEGYPTDAPPPDGAPSVRELDALDLLLLARTILRVGVGRLDRVDHVHAVGDPAEHG